MREILFESKIAPNDTGGDMMINVFFFLLVYYILGPLVVGLIRAYWSIKYGNDGEEGDGLDLVGSSVFLEQ